MECGAGGGAGDLVVAKFGGTSVGDPERIRRVAARLVGMREAGRRVVAVVSAMGDTTDVLVELARQISATPPARELDVLLSAGERISCALVAMAIQDLGCEAVSLAGSQAGIVTDTVHTKAKIVEVRAERIHEALDAGRIVLVAGFQGVSTANDITTLGRGGSDTTAVALAAALAASVCEIYTDVDGVFTADPRVVPDAGLLAALSFDEMLELAASGARVLQLRSVEFARNHGVRLHVRSTFTNADGTWIVEEDERVLEKAMLSGVTHTVEEAVFRVDGVGISDLFGALADANVNVDTIIQTGSEIVFSAHRDDRPPAVSALERLHAIWSEFDHLGKVTLVGAGMKSNPGIAARTFATTRSLGLTPQFVSTSPIKISFYVPKPEVERTVAALHDEFALGATGSAKDDR